MEQLSLAQHLEADGYSRAVITTILKFYERLIAGNRVQNLTRITCETDFYFQNVLDIQALQRLGGLGYPRIDLGSGGGIPGILHAVAYPESKWKLVEAEGRKVEFLRQCVEDLDITDRVEVIHGRFEALFRDKALSEPIVVRAVGSILKLLETLSKCSTWNTLVLFKSQKFTAEWNDAQRRFPNLELSQKIEYWSKDAYRILVEIKK